MKNDDKRDAIEILLCTAQRPYDHWESQTTHQTSDEIGLGYYSPISRFAADCWIAVDDDRREGVATHNEIALEAACRLIESSPTLRREFFGRGAR